MIRELPTAEELKKIDLSDIYNHCTADKHWIDYTSSEYYYKLLAWFSTKFDNVPLIEVGTYQGISAYCMAFNKKNHVHTFDVEDYNKINGVDNITFRKDNIINGKYKFLLQQSPFIFLDTNHDGLFEAEFYEYLQKINYKGHLLLDDTKLNDEMKNFVDSINHETIDITHIGHGSGTHLVYF